MGSTRYLMSMGELNRKDNSLSFRTSNKINHMPIEGISELYCLHEISLNTKLLDFLASNEVIVHFFNYYGNYSGTYYPRKKLRSGKVLIKQVKKFEENRIFIAKKFVAAIANNIYEVLYHYYKHDIPEVKLTLTWIKKEFYTKLNEIDSVNKLLQLEGELWQRFYSEFKNILPSEFLFNKRVKRPPDNPLNALISFGNTLLYTKTITSIYKTHLDQRISFLHEPNASRFSLSLDVAETFKPVIVYRTIFNLVNNKRLKIDKHFERKVNYCILNEEGRKIFVEAFEKRLESCFKHSQLNRLVSYKTAIKLDCYKLIKYILEDKDFELFSLKEKK